MSTEPALFELESKPAHAYDPADDADWHDTNAVSITEALLGGSAMTEEGPAWRTAEDGAQALDETEPMTEPEDDDEREGDVVEDELAGPAGVPYRSRSIIS